MKRVLAFVGATAIVVGLTGAVTAAGGGEGDCVILGTKEYCASVSSDDCVNQGELFAVPTPVVAAPHRLPPRRQARPARSSRDQQFASSRIRICAASNFATTTKNRSTPSI